MDGVIRLENITYTYPLASEPALKNINLTLERGKFYALLGANGSGKTTLCNVIRGFIPAFSKESWRGACCWKARTCRTIPTAS